MSRVDAGRPDDEEALPRMTLAEHLEELRARVGRSLLAVGGVMLASLFFYDPLWRFLVAPYQAAVRERGLTAAQLSSVDVGEGFLTALKVCFLAGAVVASPFVLWQLWGFVAAGLYRHERRLVRIFFPVSVGLFTLGMVLAYVFLIPFGLRFLIGWNEGMGLSSEFRVQSYLSMCLTAVFGMGLVFELPLVMLFLQATGLVSRRTFARGWRLAVLCSFVLGMVLTDPSPVTQIAMAIPVVGLYFLGVWGGRFVGEDREPFHWWKAWPLAIGILVVVSLLVFSDRINAWSARLFGADRGPAEAPAEPGGP